MLERAYIEAVGSGRRVAAILVNSPHNPTGHVYDEALVRSIIDFATRHGVHVVLDEIYAESLLPGVEHFTGLMLENPFVHVVYGFAKDFGLSGYKVGILHSENPDVVRATAGAAYFHTVSMLPQRALAGVLGSPLLDDFLVILRTRLESSHRHTTGELARSGVPFVAGQGGIVLWIDLRASLRSNSFAAERELCDTILRRVQGEHLAGPGLPLQRTGLVPSVPHRSGHAPARGIAPSAGAPRAFVTPVR